MRGNLFFKIKSERFKINKPLLYDLERAAKDCKIDIVVTTAIANHKKYTQGGAPSRHALGQAVDISIVNDVSYNTNRSLFTTLCNRLVKYFKSMGYVENFENGNDKAVLFGFYSKSAGNHYHHIHLSNRTGMSSVPGSNLNNSIISSKNGDIGDSNYHSDEDYFSKDSVRIVEVKNELAKGIWQIIKVVIDPDVSNRQLNDSSLSFFQGSLYNFFQQVCQQPFVEFWGDTYGDQYYFIIRTPPFTKDLYKSLPTISISDNDVLSDELSFCDEQYSWFQLTPSANYIGVEEWLNTYLPAVFFPEYAEIWGSKPLSITTQYITYIKETGKIQKEKAIDDLKFLIDTHSYLPFTRKGVIVINGDRRIKKGMRVYYEPTNEYYYVDSVSNNFSVSDGIIDRTTTLNVSRGMVSDFVDNKIIDNNTPNYFNIINFNSVNKTKNNKGSSYQDINLNIKNHVAFFNQNKYTFDYFDIDKIDSKTFFNSINKEIELKNNELLLSKSDIDDNFDNIYNIIKLADEYKNICFELVGYCDELEDQSLSYKRAKTVLEIICAKKKIYDKLNESDNGQNVIDSFKKRFNIIKNNKNVLEKSDSKFSRKQKRKVDIFIKNSDIKNLDNNTDNKNEKILSPKEGNWKVNRDVFMFFLRRQQFTIDTIRNNSQSNTLKPVVIKNKK